MAVLNDLTGDFNAVRARQRMTHKKIADILGCKQENVALVFRGLDQGRKPPLNKLFIKIWEVLGYDLKIEYIPRPKEDTTEK